MAVEITFSRVAGGLATVDILAGEETGINHGDVANGQETLAKDIYIRHDSLNEITDCKFYCREFSGVYGGNEDAVSDFSELKQWGDALATEGFLIDVNHDGIYEYNLKTGQMDSEINAVSLDDSGAGGTNPDDIGVGEEARVGLKLVIPSTVSVPGIRQFDFLLKYSYTP